MSTILVFNYGLFVAQFPAYADATKYPQPLLSGYWDIAINYISDYANCGSLRGATRQYAINLMLAHLLYLNDLMSTGQSIGLTTSATIDKVSVTIAKPPEGNQWQWWLNNSPYGQQLLSLLQVKSAGGFYIGGSSVIEGFRLGTFRRGGGCC